MLKRQPVAIARFEYDNEYRVAEYEYDFCLGTGFFLVTPLPFSDFDV